MNVDTEQNRKLGIAIVGLGGAVATTAIAGIELLKAEKIGTEGLPLAHLGAEQGLVDYRNIKFSGWDLNTDDLAAATKHHGVLPNEQISPITEELASHKPWKAIGNRYFLEKVVGTNFHLEISHRAAIEEISQNLREFRLSENFTEVVMINLASTEKLVDETAEIFSSLENFERALDENSTAISPAMLYAYAAIAEKIPYGNFTPSVAADIPALIEFAEKQQVPIAGKDGKTGQTMIKTVLAPAFKTRALKVEGWYSTNILGNRDGLALSDADSLASKIKTKSSVLEDILGYPVEDHLVDIRYYRPRGDNKEAWDNIDLVGFLGQPMQIKVNFLCRDSILAAPLVIEIARLLDLAKQRNEFGVQEQLSVFFKLPMLRDSDKKAIHSLHEQEILLNKWLFS